MKRHHVARPDWQVDDLIRCLSDPGVYQVADGFASRSGQNLCRLIERCASCQHIIDQQNMMVPDSCFAALIQLECTGQVLFALGVVEAGLTGCCLVALQEVWGK